MEAPLASPPHGHEESTPDQVRQSREIVAHLQKSAIYRAYADAFQTMTGMPLGLRAVGTFCSPLRDAKNANRLCELLSSSNQSCAACLCLQQEVASSSSREGSTQECYAGMVESTLPIRVGENIVGYLQTGQVLLRKPSASQLSRTARQLKAWQMGVPQPELEQAYARTIVMTKARYQSVLQLLSIFSAHLSTLCNQLMVTRAAAELPAVAKARSFIAEHQAEEISLSDVARAVNMSAFYFCKTFRKVTGVTFVDYLARLRIESVKTLLLNPHKRISEAAFEAGFQSLSQFNRVFRRIAGEAPTVYREKIHGSAAASERRNVVCAA